MSDISVSFVSRKINKIRWRPASKISLINDNPPIFATGSWDDEANNISLWSIATVSSNDVTLDEENNGEPKLIWETNHKGDITDLQFLSNEVLLSSSSFGSVNLFKIQKEELKLFQSWDRIHNFKLDKASCTGLASKSEEISSVGEDGRIVTLNIARKTPISVKECDSCSLTCVSYVRHQELVVGNSRGHLKMWDLKSKSETASKTFSLSGYQAPIMCLNQHPSQAHVIASGSQDGNLSIWDLRQEYHPVAVLNGHSAAISDVKFNPCNPDVLFTSSYDGSVWQWDASTIKGAPMVSSGKTVGNKLSGLEVPTRHLTGIMNPWLNCDATKHRLDIVSLLPTLFDPINCLDIVDSTLLCGCDNEAVYVVTDVKT